MEVFINLFIFDGSFLLLVFKSISELLLKIGLAKWKCCCILVKRSWVHSRLCREIFSLGNYSKAGRFCVCPLSMFYSVLSAKEASELC